MEAGDELPPQLDRARLAHFILTVMEGGLMQARAANDLKPFDESVAVLQEHLNLLRSQAAQAKDDRSDGRTSKRGGMPRRNESSRRKR